MESTSSSAVDRARTEASRRHRLRQMADADGVIFLPDNREVSGYDDETADHLRAAAQGELLDRDPGRKPFDPVGGLMPPVIALDHEAAQRVSSQKASNRG